LALAKLLLQPLNVLVMDEPTNHLDIKSKNVLKQALIKFDGTLILVSHDRDFLQNLTNKVYEFKDQKIKEFLGDIDYYLDQRQVESFREIEKKEKIIFIWPEGIIPGISQDQLKEYKWLFENKFNENHLLAIGINSKEDENKTIKYFNSLSIFDHDLNKINLVPFGEFLPFEKLLKSIGLKTITNDYQSYSKGEERNIIDLKYNNLSVKILPLICYEIIYSGKIFTNSNFDYIVNISEDGWFGKSIGPEQHFTHSIFRAIESGKYVLRSANNGTTAIINPMGVIEQKVDINKSGYIDLSESRKIEMTLFAKFGNKIFGFIILLYIFLIFSFKKLKNE